MNKWDRRYSQDESLMLRPLPLIEECCKGMAPARALDLACGSGRHSLYLAGLGWKVTAVDFSEVALELLQSRAAERNLIIDTRLANLEKGEFIIEPESYDLIIDTFYLQRGLFSQIRQGLKLGGLLIAVIALVDHDPDLKPMNPDFLLEPGELKSKFSDFEIIHYLETRRDPQKRPNAEIVARKVNRQTEL